ncbi:zinc-dependent alcohol dehydrogenase [Ammoniphilus resinae]|uniref:Threonine dehydrogenase-like Zn-dependent dehydrogenase n=1 Tax=Ammoniphilus resinae TaxID=861532 RepID=A0ABS4GKX4_9BACL|nr:zinc-binding dehydrogenase [Ammoniphilus resinae]MBP1930903.1 threonine dehydrogenase-like Zn-dependent dehydrogenase [Ammoniphilus resinae]
MKASAAVFEGPKKLSIRELEIPEIGDDDLLIETVMAGVDGSEVHMFNGELEEFNEIAPLIMGDEVIGRVTKIGKNASSQRGICEGDLVTIESHSSCDECSHCLRGQYYLCEKGWKNHAYGWISCDKPPALWGTYSTHVYAPKNAFVHKVPEQLPPEIAIVGISVLANAVRWVQRAGVKKGDIVTIIGPGPQGLMCSLVAKESGASKVIVIGLSKDSERLSMARQFGADITLVSDVEDIIQRLKEVTNDQLSDVVIESAGAAETVQLSIEIVRPGGTINHVALTGGKEIPLVTQKILFKEINFLGSISHPYTIQPALELANKLWKEKKYPLEKLVTHKFRITEAEKAIRTAAYEFKGERPIKTVLIP